MKKLIGVISSMLLIVLVFSGCGSKKTAENGNQFDSGKQGQFARADLMGEVDSIKDNQVTIKLIEMPQFNRNRGQGNNNGNNNDNNNNNDNSTYNGNRQGNQNNVQSNNGQRPSGNQNRSRSRNYTGETKTITINSDIPLTTMTMGDNGPEQKDIKVKDIKKGDMLQIWYADKNKGTISRISVGGFGGGFRGNGFGQGNRNGGYNNNNGNDNNNSNN